MNLMPSAFNRFKKLEFIPLGNISRWLEADTKQSDIENKIGNKLLYPQTVPETYDDIRTHLAIFREAIKFESEDVYSRTLKKLTLPKEFADYFPDLNQLIIVIIDSLKLDEVTHVFLAEEAVGVKSWGAILRPKLFSKSGMLELSVEGKSYSVNFGTLMILPATSTKVDLGFKSDKSRIMDRNEINFEATGGELGIVVDARLLSL